MYTEKEALEYLMSLGETVVLDIEGKKFSTKEIYSIKDPKPAPLIVTTLTALTDYVKGDIDPKYGEQRLIHVVSPDKVTIYSILRDDRERESYIRADALLPDNIAFDRFVGTEEFNIILQSSFVDNKDRELLLKVVGNVKDTTIKQAGDDGVSQVATIKTGVASVNDVVVPNPVILAPYRTFPEIEQPESKFIFRMQSGPSAALFEADGGAWRNEAMQRIKKYLEENLKGVEGVKIIS